MAIATSGPKGLLSDRYRRPAPVIGTGETRPRLYGEMGRIMESFMKNEGRLGRGLAAMEVPLYRQRFWDDDANNDGKPDGLLGAPTVTMAYDIGFAVAASVAGAAVTAVAGNAAGAAVSTAISMTDDAIFTSLDVAVGAQDADDAWEAFGKKAAATLMTNLISGGLGEVVNVGSTLVGQAAMAGMQYVASTTTSAAINSLEWNSDSFFDIDFNTDTFQDATISEDALAGLAGAVVGAGVAGNLEGFSAEHASQARSFSGLVGGAAQAGLEYAWTGETTLNMLNMNMFGIEMANGAMVSTGLLEFNIGGDRPVFNMGMGGIDASAVTVAQGVAGFGTWKENMRNTAYELFGGTRYAAGYEGIRREGTMLRSAYSYGDEELQAAREDILAGRTDMAIGFVNQDGKTTLENGRKTIHLGTLGERGRDNVNSRLRAGVVLQHEAHRNGIGDGFRGQYEETFDAVAAHTLMAMRMEQDYEGFLDSDAALREQADMMEEALASGDFSAFAEHVMTGYDFSEDNWLHTVQEINATGDLGFVSEVEAGDTLGGLIEEIYGIDPNDPKAAALVDMIVGMNPHLVDRDSIEVGEEVNLPNNQHSTQVVDGNGNTVPLREFLDTQNEAFNLAFQAETFAEGVSEAIDMNPAGSALLPNVNVSFDSLINTQMVAQMLHDRTSGSFGDQLFNNPQDSVFVGPLQELQGTLNGLGQQGTQDVLDNLSVLGLTTKQFELAASISSQIAGSAPNLNRLPSMMSFGEFVLTPLQAGDLQPGRISQSRAAVLMHEGVHSLRALTTGVLKTGQTTSAGQWVYNYGVEGINRSISPGFPYSYFGHTEELMAYAIGGFMGADRAYPGAPSFDGLLTPPSPYTGWYY